MIKKEKNYNLIIGGIITAVLMIFMFIGIFYTPHDPNAMDSSLKYADMSLKNLFGCDNFGRDLFSRVMTGSLATFNVALITVLTGTFFGVLIGALTGYYGGIIDEILMRVNDTIFAFPSILLALVFVSILGSGRNTIILALGIAFIPSFARIVRAEFLKYRDMDYIISAKLMGAGNLRIMFVHILPNTYRILLPAIIIGFNNAVLAEAGMSYLGIGVQPPHPSLGYMLSDAQSHFSQMPMMALAPGTVLILLILGFSLLSDGLSKSKAY
ncbi:MAG: ABC transporter permease [Lachnospiraceae bacterium]|nr:ABC transporter permease [Lachnospiraceae bacterium]